MASVLTDQYIAGSRAVPLAPVTTGATFVQFKTPDTQTGNFKVFLPLNGAPSSSPYRRYRAVLLGRVSTATTVNVTVNLNLIDTAATSQIIATTGAKAVNSKIGAFKLEVEFFYDPSAANLSGAFGGHVDNVLVAAAPLTNAAQPVFTGSGLAGLTVSALLSGADAASVLTVDELTLELL